MRTFLDFVIVIDPRQVGLAVLDSTQTQHTKNIQAFHYNRTLFVADDRRTRLLRGRSVSRLFLHLSRPVFSWRTSRR